MLALLEAIVGLLAVLAPPLLAMLTGSKTDANTNQALTNANAASDLAALKQHNTNAAVVAGLSDEQLDNFLLTGTRPGA